MGASIRHAAGLVAGTALLAAAGCGAPAPDTAPVQRPDVDADALRTVSADYEVEASAAGVAARSEIQVSGTVVSWSDGRALDEGSQQRSRSAVLEIAVDQSAGLPAPTTAPTPDPPATLAPSTAPPERTPPAAAPATEDPGGPRTIHVEYFRGEVDIDEDGHDVVSPGSTMLSVQDLQAAVPVGTRVLFMGGPAMTDAGHAARWGGVVSQGWQAPTADARLLAPTMQGLLLEDADGGYVSALAFQGDAQGRGWPDRDDQTSTGDEFEQLLAQVF